MSIQSDYHDALGVPLFWDSGHVRQACFTQTVGSTLIDAGIAGPPLVEFAHCTAHVLSANLKRDTASGMVELGHCKANSVDSYDKDVATRPVGADFGLGGPLRGRPHER